MSIETLLEAAKFVEWSDQIQHARGDDDKNQDHRERGRVAHTRPASVVTQRPLVSNPVPASSIRHHQSHHSRPPASTSQDVFQWDTSHHSSSRSSHETLPRNPTSTSSSRSIVSSPPSRYDTVSRSHETASLPHAGHNRSVTAMSRGHISPGSQGTAVLHHTGGSSRSPMSPKSPHQHISPRSGHGLTTSYQANQGRSQMSPTTSPRRRHHTSPRSHDAATSHHTSQGRTGLPTSPRHISPRPLGSVALPMTSSSTASVPVSQPVLIPHGSPQRPMTSPTSSTSWSLGYRPLAPSPLSPGSGGSPPFIAYRRLDFDSNSNQSEESYQGDGDDKKSDTREVHNKLEKNRRAHLKDCFDALKAQVPNMEDKKIKTSNLSILQGALRYLQALKRKERELEHQMDKLARQKITYQQRLAKLKMGKGIAKAKKTEPLLLPWKSSQEDTDSKIKAVKVKVETPAPVSAPVPAPVPAAPVPAAPAPAPAPAPEKMDDDQVSTSTASEAEEEERKSRTQSPVLRPESPLFRPKSPVLRPQSIKLPQRVPVLPRQPHIQLQPQPVMPHNVTPIEQSAPKSKKRTKHSSGKTKQSGRYVINRHVRTHSPNSRAPSSSGALPIISQLARKQAGKPIISAFEERRGVLNKAVYPSSVIPTLPPMTNPHPSHNQSGTVMPITASQSRMSAHPISQSGMSTVTTSQSGTTIAGINIPITAQQVVGSSIQSANSRQTVSQLLGKQQTPGARRPAGPTTVHTPVIQAPIRPALAHQLPYTQMPISQMQQTLSQYAAGYAAIPLPRQPLANPAASHPSTTHPATTHPALPATLANSAAPIRATLPPHSLYSQMPITPAQLQQTLTRALYPQLPVGVVRVSTPPSPVTSVPGKIAPTVSSVMVTSQPVITTSYSSAMPSKPVVQSLGITATGQPKGHSQTVGQPNVGQPVGHGHAIGQPTGQSTGQQLSQSAGQQHPIIQPQTIGQALGQIIGPALKSISPALHTGQAIAPGTVRPAVLTTTMGQAIGQPISPVPAFRPISPALHPVPLQSTTNGVTIANVAPPTILTPKTAVPSFLPSAALTQVLFTQPPVAAYSLAQSQLANALMPSMLPVLRQPVAISTTVNQPVVTQIISATHPTITVPSRTVATALTQAPLTAPISTAYPNTGAPSTAGLTSLPPSTIAPPTIVQPTMASYFSPALQAALSMSPFPVTLGPPIALNKAGQVTTPTYSSLSLGAAALQRLTMSPLPLQSTATIPITVGGTPSIPKAGAILSPLSGLGITAARLPAIPLTTVPMTAGIANNPAAIQPRVVIEPATSLPVPATPVTVATIPPVATPSAAVVVKKPLKRSRPPTPKDDGGNDRKTKKEKIQQGVTTSQMQQMMAMNVHKVTPVTTKATVAPPLSVPMELSVAQTGIHAGMPPIVLPSNSRHLTAIAKKDAHEGVLHSVTGVQSLATASKTCAYERSHQSMLPIKPVAKTGVQAVMQPLHLPTTAKTSVHQVTQPLHLSSIAKTSIHQAMQPLHLSTIAKTSSHEVMQPLNLSTIAKTGSHKVTQPLQTIAKTSVHQIPQPLHLPTIAKTSVHQATQPLNLSTIAQTGSHERIQPPLISSGKPSFQKGTHSPLTTTTTCLSTTHINTKTCVQGQTASGNGKHIVTVAKTGIQYGTHPTAMPSKHNVINTGMAYKRMPSTASSSKTSIAVSDPSIHTSTPSHAKLPDQKGDAPAMNTAAPTAKTVTYAKTSVHAGGEQSEVPSSKNVVMEADSRVSSTKTDPVDSSHQPVDSSGKAGGDAAAV